MFFAVRCSFWYIPSRYNVLPLKTKVGEMLVNFSADLQIKDLRTLAILHDVEVCFG